MTQHLPALALAALLAVPPAGQAAPTLWAGLGSPSVVTVGSVFSVPIMISDALELTAWQFDLSFDPAVLQFSGATEGPFMQAFGGTLFSGGFDLGGLLAGLAGSYVDLAPNPAGSGVLATLEFTAVGRGATALSFSNVFLNWSDQGFDSMDGAVQVVPEPDGPRLLGLALAALGLSVRRRAAPGLQRGTRP